MILIIRGFPSLFIRPFNFYYQIDNKPVNFILFNKVTALYWFFILQTFFMMSSI
ncbi:hypothetical protein FM106_21095 [Brachybacterium faecium]|nr:hypothetical protein FM106_21095 [Brachybacterium faecium]